MAKSEDSLKHIKKTIKTINRINTINKVPLNAAQTSIKIHSDSLRDIVNMANEFNKISVNAINSFNCGLKIHNKQIVDFIQSINLAGTQMDASVNAMLNIIQEHYSQINAMFDVTKSAMKINIPDYTFKIYNDELTRIINSIPKSMFINVDFAKIKMQDLSALALDMNEIDLDEYVDFNLNEEELKDVRTVIEDVASNSSAKIHDLINGLIQFAHNTVVPKLQLIALGVAKAIFNYYVVTYVILICPPVEVFKLLDLPKTEVIEQRSQELARQQVMQELSNYRLVCVTDLNVRSGPSIDMPIKYGLILGDKVKIIDSSEEWVRIQWSNDEGELLKGWVNKSYLTEPKIHQAKAE